MCVDTHQRTWILQKVRGTHCNVSIQRGSDQQVSLIQTHVSANTTMQSRGDHGVGLPEWTSILDFYMLGFCMQEWTSIYIGLVYTGVNF